MKFSKSLIQLKKDHVHVAIYDFLDKLFLILRSYSTLRKRFALNFVDKILPPVLRLFAKEYEIFQ